MVVLPCVLEEVAGAGDGDAHAADGVDRLGNDLTPQRPLPHEPLTPGPLSRAWERGRSGGDVSSSMGTI